MAAVVRTRVRCSRRPPAGGPSEADCRCGRPRRDDPRAATTPTCSPSGSAPEAARDRRARPTTPAAAGSPCPDCRSRECRDRTRSPTPACGRGPDRRGTPPPTGTARSRSRVRAGRRTVRPWRCTGCGRRTPRCRRRMPSTAEREPRPAPVRTHRGAGNGRRPCTSSDFRPWRAARSAPWSCPTAPGGTGAGRCGPSGRTTGRMPLRGTPNAIRPPRRWARTARRGSAPPSSPPA